jgi:hypothetical protein
MSNGPRRDGLVSFGSWILPVVWCSKNFNFVESENFFSWGIWDLGQSDYNILNSETEWDPKSPSLFPFWAFEEKIKGCQRLRMERCLQTSWRPIGCLPIKPYHSKARLPQSLYSDNFPCYIITLFQQQMCCDQWMASCHMEQQKIQAVQ